MRLKEVTRHSIMTGVTLFSKIDTGKLVFTSMKKMKHQHTSQVTYGTNDCVILTPEFELTSGGIMPKNDLGYNRDSMLVPLDANPKFKELLEDIDEAVLTNSETIFGDTVNLSNKTHILLVKKLESFKLKLRIDYNSKNVLTKVFEKGVKVETNTVDDVAKYVTWGSTIQMVILIEKVWANNSVWLETDDEPVFGELEPPEKDAKFGVSLVVLQVNVTKKKKPTQRSKTLDAFYESNTFGK